MLNHFVLLVIIHHAFGNENDEMEQAMLLQIHETKETADQQMNESLMRSVVDDNAGRAETRKQSETSSLTLEEFDGGRALLNTRLFRGDQIYMSDKSSAHGLTMYTKGKSWSRVCSIASKAYESSYYTIYWSEVCSSSLTQVDTIDDSPPFQQPVPPRSANTSLVETSETLSNFYAREIFVNKNGDLYCKEKKNGEWERVESFTSEIYEDHWNTWFSCTRKTSALLQQEPNTVHEIDTAAETVASEHHYRFQPERAVNLIESSYKPIPSCNEAWYKEKATWTFKMFQIVHSGDELHIYCGNDKTEKDGSWNKGTLWPAENVVVDYPDGKSYYDMYTCKLMCQ